MFISAKKLHDNIPQEGSIMMGLGSLVPFLWHLTEKIEEVNRAQAFTSLIPDKDTR